MQLVNKLLCISCLHRFDDDRKPCLGTCSHTICVQCKGKMKTSQCPVCKRADAFKETVINYPALEAVKALDGKVDLDDFKEFIADEQNISQGPCFECNEYTQRLRLCIECSERAGDIQKIGDDYLLATVRNETPHKFLVLKSQSICANCAIEGVHGGHKTVPIFKALRPNLEDNPVPIEKIKSNYQLIQMEFEQQKSKKKQRLTPLTLYTRDRKEVRRYRRLSQMVRKEAMEKAKWEERFNLMVLEMLNLSSLFVDPTSTTSRENVEELRVKTHFNGKHLTARDVSRMDEKILERIKEMGSSEGLEARIEKDMKAYVAKMREKGKANEQFLNSKSSKTNTRKAIALATANIALSRAERETTLNALTKATIHCIGAKIRILRPFFDPGAVGISEYRTKS